MDTQRINNGRNRIKIPERKSDINNKKAHHLTAPSSPEEVFIYVYNKGLRLKSQGRNC
jgi:hypothetical protein